MKFREIGARAPHPRITYFSAAAWDLIINVRRKKTMIYDLEACVKEEVRNQIAYLALTPVASIAGLLRDGRCVLKKGVIRSLSYLAGIKTEFGEIGPLVPKAREGEKKFLVSEIVPMLRANPEVEDNGLLAAIERFMVKGRLGDVTYNVTIFDFGSEYIIKDGDKRTISFYENNRSAGSDSIEYPVFVVSSSA